MSLVGRLAAVGSVLVVAALVLAGCGGGPAETVSAPSAAADTSTAAGDPSQAPASTAAPAAAPVPGAYAGAGGPRPAGAEPLPTYVSRYGKVKSAHLSSPSGGIKCDFQVADSSGSQGLCGVRSYFTKSPYGCTQVAGSCKQNWIYPFSGDRVGEITATAGTTGWMNQPANDGYQVPVIAYGKVVYFDDWVCASAQNGMTCWNTKTGSGVFMSNERSEMFTGTGSATQASATAPTTTEQTGGEPIVLGSMPSNGTGYGTARPATIYNGSSITGRLTGVAWSSWGGDRADGRGTAYNAMGDVTAGAPESYPVIVVALDIGTCNGKRAYRKLLVYKPGGYLNPGNAVDICWS